MKSLESVLKLVEYTSIPLSVLMLFYVLSGYGMISTIPSYIGFTYSTSFKIHTLPLLRYLTTVLVALHGCCGLILMAYRRVKSEFVRDLITYLSLAYAGLMILIATVSEITLILP